ncbi:hypothetical protein M885DRAFT_614931 [Pelagophyceae sp. CCMP2097]|nr:hypothetical protein M885DRAFT_614931 [Pelagophyceae sp. CCMP2097]
MRSPRGLLGAGIAARSGRPLRRFGRRFGATPVASHTYELACVDLHDLGWFWANEPPPSDAVRSLKAALARGDDAWCVRRHGVPQAVVENAVGAAAAFFDLPAELKHRHAVGGMDRSRGFEIYPHHLRHHKLRLEQLRQDGPELQRHVEPSADQGICCERYVMGAPEACDAAGESVYGDDYYKSDWARVFYEANKWPDEADAPTLRQAMTQLWSPIYVASAASLRVLCAALGAPPRALEHLIRDPRVPGGNDGLPLRHHSRLQMNNYPSIPGYAFRNAPLRANTHLDTSLLTVLARSASEGVADGALEIRRGQDETKWARVPSPPDTLTVQLGSLIEYFTNGRLKGATHRVTNPPREFADDSRRLSAAFVLKPDYSAVAAPPPGLEAVVGRPAGEPPLVGHVGRVGWQNFAMMQNEGMTKHTAVILFKPWKLHMRSKLGLRRESPDARL